VRPRARPDVEAWTPPTAPEMPAKTASEGRSDDDELEEGVKRLSAGRMRSEWPGRFVRGIEGRDNCSQTAADQGPAAISRRSNGSSTGVALES
jgi:hypothetical protein